MNSKIIKICYIILFLCFIAIIKLIVLLVKCKSTSNFKLLKESPNSSDCPCDESSSNNLCSCEDLVNCNHSKGMNYQKIGSKHFGF